MKTLMIERTKCETTEIKRDLHLRPFLKWAGGKRRLTSRIRHYVPAKYNIYFEPFVGAGAVLFDLQPRVALINDANEELINCYRLVRNEPSKLIEHAKCHRNTKAYFYRLRALDREPTFERSEERRVGKECRSRW